MKIAATIFFCASVCSSDLPARDVPGSFHTFGSNQQSASSLSSARSFRWDDFVVKIKPSNVKLYHGRCGTGYKSLIFLNRNIGRRCLCSSLSDTFAACTTCLPRCWLAHVFAKCNVFADIFAKCATCLLTYSLFVQRVP